MYDVINPEQGEFGGLVSDILAGDGNIEKLFFTVKVQ
jgi:hypothetical protein